LPTQEHSNRRSEIPKERIRFMSVRINMKTENAATGDDNNE